MSGQSYHRGFTIVELLIVVVVIAILAAISIVAYTGIQNRAYDTSVQNDLRQLSKQLDIYYTDTGAYPTSDAQLTTMNLRVSKSAYGRHVVSGADTYNLLYCRPQASNMARYALIASSRSGMLYQFIDGTITTIARTSWDTAAVPSATLCSNTGIATSTAQMWFYMQGSWRPFIAG